MKYVVAVWGPGYNEHADNLERVLGRLFKCMNFKCDSIYPHDFPQNELPNKFGFLDSKIVENAIRCLFFLNYAIIFLSVQIFCPD